MYLELTLEDTMKDLQNLLIGSIDGFEFPRVNLYDYEVLVEEIFKTQVEADDFVIKEIPSVNSTIGLSTPAKSIVDRSNFVADLNPEEINILALLMKN